MALRVAPWLSHHAELSTPAEAGSGARRLHRRTGGGGTWCGCTHDEAGQRDDRRRGHPPPGLRAKTSMKRQAGPDSPVKASQAEAGRAKGSQRGPCPVEKPVGEQTEEDRPTEPGLAAEAGLAALWRRQSGKTERLIWLSHGADQLRARRRREHLWRVRRGKGEGAVPPPAALRLRDDSDSVTRETQEPASVTGLAQLPR